MARQQAESCRLVAGWEPGADVGRLLLEGRLALLKTAGHAARLDATTVAELVDYLIEHAGFAAGRSPHFNLMLYPWLLSLKRPRTPQQREQAIAWIEARLRGRKDGATR